MWRNAPHYESRRQLVTGNKDLLMTSADGLMAWQWRCGGVHRPQSSAVRATERPITTLPVIIRLHRLHSPIIARNSTANVLKLEGAAWPISDHLGMKKPSVSERGTEQ